MINSNYCEKFGCVPKTRLKQLMLLELREEDLKLAIILHDEIISPNIEAITSNFYKQILKNKDVREIFSHGFSIGNLKKTQTTYLLSLGINFNDPTYFNNRLYVGHIHARIGIKPTLYQCSFRILQDLIIQRIPINHPGFTELLQFVLKITTLDMTLAIHAYEYELTDSIAHNPQSNNFNSSDEIQIDRSVDPSTFLASKPYIILNFSVDALKSK